MQLPKKRGDPMKGLSKTDGMYFEEYQGLLKKVFASHIAVGQWLVNTRREMGKKRWAKFRNEYKIPNLYKYVQVAEKYENDPRFREFVGQTKALRAAFILAGFGDAEWQAAEDSGVLKKSVIMIHDVERIKEDCKKIAGPKANHSRSEEPLPSPPSPRDQLGDGLAAMKARTDQEDEQAQRDDLIVKLARVRYKLEQANSLIRLKALEGRLRALIEEFNY